MCAVRRHAHRQRLLRQNDQGELKLQTRNSLPAELLFSFWFECETERPNRRMSLILPCFKCSLGVGVEHSNEHTVVCTDVGRSLGNSALPSPRGQQTGIRLHRQVHQGAWQRFPFTRHSVKKGSCKCGLIDDRNNSHVV